MSINATSVPEDKGFSRRKKRTLAGTGALAGVSALAVLAAWTGQAGVSTGVEAGSFALEVSTDDGQNWSDSAQLAFSEVVEQLAPGETETSPVLLRLVEGTTHDAVITDVALDFEGALTEHMEWSLSERNGVDLLSGEAFTNGERALGLPLAVGEVIELDLSVVAEDSADFAQNATASGTWTFNAGLENAIGNEGSNGDNGDGSNGGDSGGNNGGGMVVTNAGYFTFLPDSGAITRYSADGPKDVVIPAEIDGVPVTVIGISAFSYRGVTTVYIPSSVTRVAGSAFGSTLTHVSIGPNTTYDRTSFPSGATIEVRDE